MTVLPADISVSFDFSSGATFGYPFVIGDPKYGVLGTSQLGGSTVPEPIYDLTPMVYSITITRGRSIQRDTYETGTATIRVMDPNSYFNPQNANSPFAGYLTPLRKIRVSATTATTQKYLFSGYTTDYKYSYPTNQDTGYVDIVCADAFRLFQLATVQTVSGATAGQDTGTRINKILDVMQFPANMRTIDTGQSLCQADPGTARPGLEALKNPEFCEQGAFYINTSGTAVFKNRNATIQSVNGTPIEFNQTGGIPYQNPLNFIFDDKLIINNATMTPVGGTGQTYTNTASVAKYFPHQQNQSNLVIDTDANALNIAATYVATRQETTIRVDQMKVNLLDPGVPTDTIIGMDYFSNVRISNIQPDGSTITKTLQAQGFKWEITPKSMQVTITTLEPITDGFIVGSSTNGIIGVSALTW